MKRTSVILAAAAFSGLVMVGCNESHSTTDREQQIDTGYTANTSVDANIGARPANSTATSDVTIGASLGTSGVGTSSSSGWRSSDMNEAITSGSNLPGNTTPPAGRSSAASTDWNISAQPSGATLPGATTQPSTSSSLGTLDDSGAQPAGSSLDGPPAASTTQPSQLQSPPIQR